nr:Blp family class II bacteriocin [uncultured Cellulosilyticum sp.]
MNNFDEMTNEELMDLDGGFGVTIVLATLGGLAAGYLLGKNK